MFYFVFGGNFQVQAPRWGWGGAGAYIWRGDFTEGFLRYEFWGLIFEILQYLLEPEKKIIYLFVGIFPLAIIGVKVLSLQKLLCVT